MASLKLKYAVSYLKMDAFALIFTLFLSAYFLQDYKVSKREWVALSICLVLWQVGHYVSHVYDIRKKQGSYISFYNHFKALVTVLLVSLPILFLFPAFDVYSSKIKFVAVAFPLFGLALVQIVEQIIKRVINSSKKVSYTLVVGVGEQARNVELEIASKKMKGHQVKGFVSCLKGERCAVGRDMVVTELNEIHPYLKNNVVDEIVIALPGNPYKKIKRIMSVADYYGIRVKYVPDYHQIFGNNYKVIQDGGLATISTRQMPLDDYWNSFVKSIFDSFFSSMVLMLLAPLFLLIAALIKLESKGPVFYCPIRVGKGGRAFKVYKFRTMYECDSNQGGTLSTQKNDARITKMGKWLRKYNIDELPQFFNVFSGEMSVVGPRPHRRYLNQQLQENVCRYMIRHYIKPGITGWAQVNGWRGPTDTEEQRIQRTLHDLWYLENWTFVLDCKIIIKTIFSRKAYQNAF